MGRVEAMKDRFPTEPRSRAAAAAAFATVLIAGVIGLIAGRDAPVESRIIEKPSGQAVDLARAEARAEIKAKAARQGFRDGQRDGARHGRVAGRAAGRTDARVAIADQELASAQAEAAAAQSELSGMTAAPAAP